MKQVEVFKGDKKNFESLAEQMYGDVLREREALHTVLRCTSDIVIRTNLHKQMIAIDVYTEEILGWTKEEWLALDKQTLLHKQDLKYIDEIKNNFEARFHSDLRATRWRCKDGSYVWIQWVGIKFEDDGYILYLGRDVSTQKKLESNEASVAQIIEMERIKSKFFADVSHELKTPVAIILASIQLLSREIKDGEIVVKKGFDTKSYIKRLQQNSYRLLRTVNNLIDITKIDAGYYTLQCVHTNIVQVIEEMTLSVVDYTEHKGIDILFDTREEEIITWCDPEKIERIILNLLSNAIKHTEQGGSITVTIDVEKNQTIRLVIKDTGQGIPEDKLPYIFERFMKAETRGAKKVEGSGIGLSLVKALVELHNGKIEVNSQYGVGTEMIVTLPISHYNEETLVNTYEGVGQDRLQRCNIELSDIN